MTTHTVYTWVHRVNAHGEAVYIGWKCSCGREGARRNHPTREAALADAQSHQEET